MKTIHSKKYGVDKIVFTHHKDSVLYSSKNGWDGEKTETQSYCAPTAAIQAWSKHRQIVCTVFLAIRSLLVVE